LEPIQIRKSGNHIRHELVPVTASWVEAIESQSWHMDDKGHPVGLENSKLM